jgi:CcmD family protein
MSVKRISTALLFSIALSSGRAALAAPEGATKTATASMFADPSKKDEGGWAPITDQKKTEVDPNPLVVGAYAVFFVCMFGYVLYIARGQAAIAKEMKDLAERIKGMEKK